MRAIFFLIFAVILFSGCRNRPDDPFFCWEGTEAGFDTLTRDLDRAWAMGVGADSLSLLTDSLARLADEGTLSVVKKARAHYFAGRWHSAFSTYKEAIPELQKAERLYGDSLSFPYAFNRIKYVTSLSPETATEQQYFDNTELLAFFESRGDSIMAANVRTNIGNILLNDLDDPDGARPYFEQALKTMEHFGMRKWQLKFSLPMAQILHEKEPHRSDSIISSLIGNEIVRKDSLYFNVVLHVAYQLTGNIKHIEEAYPLITRRPGFTTVEALYESYMVNNYLRQGIQTDSVLRLAETAKNKLYPGCSLSSRVSVTNTCAKVYHALNMRDSALAMYIVYANLMDSVNHLNFIENVHTNEIKRNIALSESTAREQMLTERWQLGMIIMAILLISTIVIYLLYRHIHKLQLQKIRTDLEITRNQLSLASTVAVMEEKNKVIQTIQETIESLQSTGKVNYNDANLIKKTIKSHQSNNAALEAFQEIHKKLDPSFQKRLKDKFPSLSENNIKMACYISIGMDNRQIARLMSIDYKSVITARHRLRAKMGIARGESLEDMLREYSGV